MRLKKLKFILFAFILFLSASLIGGDVFDVYESQGINYRRELERQRVIGCYYPCRDQIHLLRRGQYRSVEELNQTALHELSHWTRHDRRLGPMKGPDFYEEILCEISAAVVAGELGLPRPSAKEVGDDVRGYLRRRRLRCGQWKMIFDETRGTISYILGREYPRDKLAEYFVATEIVNPRVAKKLIS